MVGDHVRRRVPIRQLPKQEASSYETVSGLDGHCRRSGTLAGAASRRWRRESVNQETVPRGKSRSCRPGSSTGASSASATASTAAARTGVATPRTKRFAHAKAAAGPWSLVAEAGGRRLAVHARPSRAGRRRAGTKVAEVGPIPRPAAKEYLLRINEASGRSGQHHQGALAPRLRSVFRPLRGDDQPSPPHGAMRVAAGHASTGNIAGTPMRVSSSGATPLHSLVMFVVDADKPFSSPAWLDAP